MVKGRRAADRRREREGDAQEAFDDDDPLAETNVNFTPDYSVVATPPEAEEPVELSASHLSASRTDLNRTRVVKLPLKVRHGGRLTVLAGPDAGQRSRLRQSPARLGRFRECEFPLSDPKVSRVHALLNFDPEEEMWTLQDQGSTSGTLVRGEPVEGETRLRHGDVIEVGESILRFTWSEELPEIVQVEHTRTEDIRAARVEVAKEVAKEELKKKSEKVWGSGQTQLLLATVGAVLVLALGGALAWGIVHWTGTDTEQRDEQVQLLISDIRGFLAELNLSEARARMETALALDPSNKTIQSLLRILESEEAAQRALTQARAAIDEGELEKAASLLKRVPNTSGFSAQRDKFARQIEDVYRRRSLSAVQALVDARDFEAAREKLEAHLAKYPRDKEALALRDRLDALVAQANAHSAGYKRAMRAFAQGDRQRARVIMSGEAKRGARGAERWLGELDRFERALLAGKLALKRKQGERAASELSEAWALVKRLGGSQRTAAGRQVARPYSDALYLRALSKLSAGRRCEAAQLFRKAKGISSSNRKVAAKVRQMEQKAREGLLRAQAARAGQPERAKAIAREHLCYTSASSSLGKQLARLAK